MSAFRLIAAVVCLTNLFISPQSQAITSPVGATAGQFRVSESGAATYNIPIALPPGTAGMQPSLSLDYNSQGGNGLLGVGWSLGGLSAISRCPQTQAQDGVRGSVNYDGNDRFCLEGQRLIVVSGAYGADGAEYRTEIESYSRIVSYGAAGNGPAYFKVWSKNGQVMEYGVTNDSRIEAQGKSSVAVWALNMVQDTVGNYLTVTYAEDNANGQYYPARIDYTGNAGKGLAPYNSVQFVYEARPDITPLYDAGSLMKTTVRLKNVQTYAGAILVRDYRLGYEQGINTKRSRLLSVQECGNDGVCLPATSFGWQSSGSYTPAALQSGQHFLGHPYGVPGWVIPFDYDGDGYQDLAIFNSSSDRWYTIAHNNRDGTFTKVAQGQNFLGFPYGSPQTTATVTAFDYNGDGKQDLLFVNSSGDGWYQIARSNGDGTFTSVSTGQHFLGHPYGDPGWVIPFDFNGDGRQDIAIFNSSSDRWYTIGLSNGDGTFTKVAQGQNFLGFPYGSPQSTFPIIAADFNQDGKADLAFFNSSADRWYMFALSNGDGTFRSLSSGQNFLGFPYGSPQSTAGIVPIDYNGSGRPELLFLNGSSDGWYEVAQVYNGAAPDILSSITTGLSATTSITYKPLTDPTVYTKDTTSTYPTVDIQAPMYVVSSSSSSNGIGGNYQMNYRYSGLKARQDGRGSLGFRSMDITDPQTGIVTHNEYRQDYPYIGAASLSTKTLNGTLLNQAQNTYIATPLGGTRYAVMLSQTIESSYELNGSLVTSMTTSTQYDAYGNPTQIVTSTGDGYTKTSNNTYTNDTTNWLLGRLTQASVTSATPNAGTLTRTSSFAYNPANGLLTQEVVEPNNSALRLQTDYTYDGYGNKQTVTVSGAGIAARTTTSIYDSRGQFPVTTTNALNQSDNGTYDARFGKPATLTGPNNLTTTWSYDGFGRKVLESRADGTQTTMTYYSCDGTCPNFAKYYVSNTTAGAPTSYAYFDSLSREVRMAVQGFDGRLIIKDTYYDSFGRVDRVTKPYYSGDSPLYYYNQYDVLGRVLKETSPDNSTKQMSYNGLTSSMTNSLNQTETKTKNSQGQLVSVTDNLGNVISYLYDPFGNLLKTTDPKGNVTSLTYDLRGRKIAMNDPDMGAWSYQYNVLGELIAQTDAKNQVVTMSYDVLGRILTRNEPDLKSTWTYDTAAKGVGKLAKTTADNGFQRVYTYDGYGRVATETSTIDTTYSVSKSYDAYGRVSVLTYPTGVAIKNVYNAYGYLSEVRNNASNALFWKGNAKDADGHVINETLGNGLTTIRTYTNSTGRVASIAVGPNGTPTIQNQSFAFDSLGNLIYRYDPLQGQSEAFGYDGLNRLTTATQGAVTSTVAYDSIGNITNKSDVGNYTYGAKPHAVTQVSSSQVTETVWVDDATPAGAVLAGDEPWTWITANPTPFAGAKAHQSAIKAGTHQHYFYNATAKLAVAAGETLFTYVYLDPANPPTEVMLQWNDGSWEHRAYWGANQIGWGTDGTVSRKYMGPLPATGQWVRLEVPASAVGLEGKTLNGMAFTLYGGRATWDKAGKVGAGAGATYTYDANGNMTSGAGRTVTLTSYNLPSRITQGANSVDFLYDADHMRMRKVTATETSIYLNPRIDQGMHFEKEVKGGVTEYKHYIYGAAGLVGVHTTSSAASPKTSYFHQDHLGSVVAVTDDSATVIARFAFDPWGKRKLLAGDDHATHHGFTGHEHLDEVGLVHMNGRIYDPVLARFMSADPYIQSPDNLQSYNRYSYVWNNPLSATDPSGYFSLKKFFRAAVAVAALVFAPEIAAFAGGTFASAIGVSAAVGQGIIGGAIIGYVSSGTLRGTITGGLSGALFGGIGDLGLSGFDKVFAHAAGGCFVGAATGGDCGSGALSAGAGAAFGPVFSSLGRVGEGIARAVIGGTFSVIGGGKFANGAITATYAYLFNELGNHATGKAAEAAKINELRAVGREVAEQVRLRLLTEAGRLDAIADYAYREGDRIVFGEVKDGAGARFTANQKVVYEALAEGRVVIVDSAVRSNLGIVAGTRYAVALTIDAAAGSRVLRQVARMIGNKYVGGALTILGTAPVMAADLFLHSADAGRNSDCVGCLNAGQ